MMRRGGLILAALVTLVAPVALAGCASEVGGQATVSFGEIDPGRVAGLPVQDGPSGPKDVEDATLEVRGGTDDADDRLAVNALSDVIDYWRVEMPRSFGKQFEPLREFVSFDSAGTPVGICGGSSKGLVNAFYCPSKDTVGWDRGQLVPFVRKQFGDLAVVSIFAHEMGHAVQYRLSAQTGVTKTTPTIIKEQQADCFAGAFFRWVAEDKAEHFAMSTGEGLNQVLATMLFIRDEPGEGSYTDQGAHGSAFDRVYALQAGFAEGTKRCAAMDAAEIEGRATQEVFADNDVSGGNVPVDQQTVGLLMRSLEQAFAATGTPTPSVRPNEGTCPSGAGTPPASYCPGDNSISIDVAKLIEYATPPQDGDITKGGDLTRGGGIGDFAAFAEIASRYAMAVQRRLGIPLDDAAAGLRTTCLTGAWAGYVNRGSGERETQIRLSVGDLDEAIAELLNPRSVISADVAGNRVRSGFARVEAFRVGFIDGSRSCTQRFR